MGYSQGGAVALQLALRHPALVSKVVPFSAAYRKDGWYSSALAGIEGLRATAFAGTPVEKAFKQHTPDPAAFDAYVEKMRVLGINDHEMSDAQLSSISAKTMVIERRGSGSGGDPADGSGRALGDSGGGLACRHLGRVGGAGADGESVPR
jgi:pimeloyl-ACP methyl ester carboxylesterase